MRLSLPKETVLTAVAVLVVLSIPVSQVSAMILNWVTPPSVALEVNGPATANRQALFTDSFIVTNAGGSVLHNVILMVRPSYGLNFVAASSDAACVYNGTQVTCSIASMSVGESRKFGVSFTTPFDSQCMEVSYNVDGTVSSDETGIAVTRTRATTVQCYTPSNSWTFGSSSASSLSLWEQKYQDRQKMRLLSHQFNPYASSSSSSSYRSSIPPYVYPTYPTVPANCGTYGCAQQVRVFLDASSREVLPGDTVQLVGHVQNLTNGWLRNVEVDFYYDANQLVSVSGNGAGSGPRRLTWFIDLAPNDVRELRFSGTVPSNAQGPVINGSLRALGVGGYPSANLQLSLIGKLPQTGAGFLGSIEDTSKFLSPVGAGGGSMALVLALLTGFKVLVAGGLVGRKLFVRI